LGLFDLREQMTVNERTFFEGTCHISLLLLHWTAIATNNDKPIG
jgi:hypothetical protein